MDPQQQADNTQITSIRNNLLKSLGLNDGSTTQDPYTQAFLKESLRNTQPELENSLIGRGLGGSSVYTSALTDLFSKLGTQATLNSQAYKTNALSALNNNYFAPQQQMGENLLSLANGRDVVNNSAALDLYKTLLPLTAKVNVPTPSFWQGLGSSINPIYGDTLRTQGYQSVPGMTTADYAKLAMGAF